MKEVQLKTMCPCGHELEIWVKKPAYLGLEVGKIDCKACGSKFLIKLKIGNDRQVQVDLGVQELSQIAQDILRADIDERNKANAQGNVAGGTDRNGQNAGSRQAKGADKVN